MNWIVDIVLIALIVFIVVFHTKRGCKTLLNLISPIVCFFSAYFFGPTVGRKFFGGFMLEKTSNVVYDSLKSIGGEGAVGVEELFGKLPETLSNMLDRAGTTLNQLDNLYSMAGENADIYAIFTDKIAPAMADFLSAALGCIIVFIASIIIMFFVKMILNAAFKLPVLKQANTLLGFIIGVISAVAYTWIICVALSMLVEYQLIGEYNQTIASLAESSIIFRFFCSISLHDIVNIVPIFK